ncbi:MAG: helix-turn-helix domain-containing protein [Pseudomonadota bacterium]
MIDRPLEQVSARDITALVDARTPEDRTLEFKRELPGSSPDDIKEFLADATSFANTQGGDILFGIDDRDGVAAAVRGLAGDRIDDEILRLENLLRDGVEPRLSGARFAWIEVAPDRGVLLLRISSSLAAPHRVKFRNSARFHARNSRGKYEMDTFELRQAFAASEGFPAQIRALHAQAVAVGYGDAPGLPFHLTRDPAAVATVVPMSALRETRALPITRENALAPVLSGSGFYTLNALEGVIAHAPVLPTPDEVDSRIASYAVTHWRGRTDSGWSLGGRREVARGQTVQLVWPLRFENGLLDMGRSTVAKLGSLGIEGPWVVMVTVRGIKDHHLVLGDYDTSDPAWRDGATLPELILEHVDERSLQPIFEAFWLLFGQIRPPVPG